MGSAPHQNPDNHTDVFKTGIAHVHRAAWSIFSKATIPPQYYIAQKGSGVGEGTQHHLVLGGGRDRQMTQN